VRLERKGDYTIVYAGQTPIVSVTAEDATLGGVPSKEDHAAAIAAKVREAIRSEQKRSAIATTVFSLSLVVLFGLVTLYLLRKASEFTRRARAWIADNPERIPAIKLKSLDVLKPGAIRTGLDVTRCRRALGPAVRLDLTPGWWRCCRCSRARAATPSA
jgi:hypothetical protein